MDYSIIFDYQKIGTVYNDQSSIVQILSIILPAFALVVAAYTLYRASFKSGEIKVIAVSPPRSGRLSLILCLTNLGARSCLLEDKRLVTDKLGKTCEVGSEKIYQDSIQYPVKTQLPMPINGGDSIRYEIGCPELDSELEKESQRALNKPSLTANISGLEQEVRSGNEGRFLKERMEFLQTISNVSEETLENNFHRFKQIKKRELIIKKLNSIRKVKLFYRDENKLHAIERVIAIQKNEKQKNNTAGA